MQITRDDLVAICPPPKGGARRLAWNSYVQALTSPEGGRLLAAYGITTPLRLQHLLATFAVETGLTVIWESGAYSPQRLFAVFGAGRHSARLSMVECEDLCGRRGQVQVPGGGIAPAAEYAIFERVYGIGNPTKARGLGNTLPGDGYRYRGVGLIQTTGKAAHMAAAQHIGCRVDELCQPIHCIHAALLEWDERNCNRYADADDVVSIRKLINGGSLRASLARINGLPEARRALQVAKMVITPSDFETSPPAANVGASDAPPASMSVSTEGQAAAATGGGGGLTLFQGAQTAIQKAAGAGDLSTSAIFMQLVAEPLVWAGAIAIAGSVYWFFKRRKRLYLDGV